MIFVLLLMFGIPTFFISSIIRGKYLNKIAEDQNFKYNMLCYIPMVQAIAALNIPSSKEISIFEYKISKKTINMVCIASIFMSQILIFPLILFPRLCIICIPIIFGIFNYFITKDVLDIYLKKDNHLDCILAQIIPFYKTFLYKKCTKVIDGEISGEFIETIKESPIKEKPEKEKKPKKEKIKKKKNTNDIYDIDNDTTDDKYQL